MKVLITGDQGQLGSEIRELSGRYPEMDFVFTDVHNLDITDVTQVDSLFKKDSFDLCINCAAYTAVDKAESEEEACYLVNVKGAVNLATACKENNSKFIHISTDFVFDGMKNMPYKEDDHTNPLGVYGRSKLLGEDQILEVFKNIMIIRTSWVYSSFGSNFVKTMLRLGAERDHLNVVFDQVGTPTYAGDLADCLLKIAGHKEWVPGIFHYSNEGVTSWYDFAIEIMEQSQTDCDVNPIESKDYTTPASRPTYSVLNKTKIKDTFGIVIPYWKTSLTKCIQLINSTEHV
ncbi:MAG: dTDP-4-dehydrorhamnose reductase [Bacteroidetes bacterium]|nr:dTDP-4-dehydrorhamnose reductase [Bacteroidota bacterium]